jgi:GAF domain-containing protein
MKSKPNSATSQEANQSFDLFSWRETFVLNVLRISCLLGVPLLIIAYPTATLSDRILYVTSYLIIIAVTLGPVSYLVRAYVFLVILFAIGFINLFILGTWSDANVFFIASIFLSAIFLDRRVDIIVLASSILVTATFGILQLIGFVQIRTQVVATFSLIDWAIYIVDFGVMGSLIVAAVRQFKRVFIRIVQEAQTALSKTSIERITLEERITEQTNALENRMLQLRNSIATTRAIAKIQNVSELIEETTKQISEKFQYYHTGLLILDEKKQFAYLQASSSDVGQKFIGQTFNIEPDRKSPLSNAVELKRAIITTDIEQKNFFADEKFPLTRSRMILPLIVRGEIIGLLDLHSDQPNSFDIEDAEILQTLADLTAITFDNARLVNETQNLVSQLELNTTLQTQHTWSKLTSRQMPAYQYTPAGVRPIFSREKRSDEEEGLQVPLVLQGQTIGNIRLKRKSQTRAWSEREKAVIEKIADQVSLALENSRLVEEAQKSAARDQVIANISTRIRETLDIEAVTRTATAELRRVFDLKEAEIILSTPKRELQ